MCSQVTGSPTERPKNLHEQAPTDSADVNHGIFTFILSYVPQSVKSKCRPLVDIAVAVYNPQQDLSETDKKIDRCSKAIIGIGCMVLLSNTIPLLLRPIEMLPILGSTLTFIPQGLYRLTLCILAWQVIANLLPCSGGYPTIHNNLNKMLPDIIMRQLPKPTV